MQILRQDAALEPSLRNLRPLLEAILKGRRQGGDRGRFEETGDTEPSPSYYVKPRALIYKGLRQLTISLYLSKQS